jgi:4-hydroxythreonine-4-phosphate dehydrogenase
MLAIMGLFTEDDQIIRPTVEKANEQGIFCFGPYPADGFFAKGAYEKFDAVLAMYHDQGLILLSILPKVPV